MVELRTIPLQIQAKPARGIELEDELSLNLDCYHERASSNTR